MNYTSNKAFTLIELLVVITIIGILATGAVSIYTSQIQKGRDATRITSVNALRGGIEQFYQDFGAYPNRGSTYPGGDTEFAFSGIKQFVPNLPRDPKTKQFSNLTSFEYTYNVREDDNGILNQVYEVSTGLENSGNIKSKATTDGGADDSRLEVGVIIDTKPIPTNIAGAQTNVTSWVEDGSPTDANSCVGASGATVTACDTASLDVVLVIK